MALVRQWIPSPNFSASRARNQLVVLHTSEGSTSQTGLAGFLASPSAGVSYHCCFDDAGDPNVIVECLRPQNKAWAALAANDWGVHGCMATPSGASAGWTRDVWLSKRTMLAKAAAWVREECGRYGIPVAFVDAGAIRAGARGVCGHAEVAAAGAGGGHFDPGPRFPWDELLKLAGGAGPIQPEDDLTPEEHTLLRQLHESIPMLRDVQAKSNEIATNVAGTGQMNEIKLNLLRDIKGICEAIKNDTAGTGFMNEWKVAQLRKVLDGVNELLAGAGKPAIAAAEGPKA